MKSTLEIEYLVNGSPMVLRETFFESDEDCDALNVSYRVEIDSENQIIWIDETGGEITIKSGDRSLVE